MLLLISLEAWEVSLLYLALLQALHVTKTAKIRLAYIYIKNLSVSTDMRGRAEILDLHIEKTKIDDTPTQ